MTDNWVHVDMDDYKDPEVENIEMWLEIYEELERNTAGDENMIVRHYEAKAAIRRLKDRLRRIQSVDAYAITDTWNRLITVYDSKTHKQIFQWKVNGDASLDTEMAREIFEKWADNQLTFRIVQWRSV
jgi:hypothetical protein